MPRPIFIPPHIPVQHPTTTTAPVRTNVVPQKPQVHQVAPTTTPNVTVNKPVVVHPIVTPVDHTNINRTSAKPLQTPSSHTVDGYAQHTDGYAHAEQAHVTVPAVATTVTPAHVATNNVPTVAQAHDNKTVATAQTSVTHTDGYTVAPSYEGKAHRY